MDYNIFLISVIGAIRYIVVSQYYLLDAPQPAFLHFVFFANIVVISTRRQL